YLLAFALGMVAVVDNPARQTFAAEMVGSEGMANAIALNSATFNLARIVGPAVAGLVIAAVGTPVAFLINAASYGAVLVGLKLMRESELRPLARAPKAPGPAQRAADADHGARVRPARGGHRPDARLLVIPGHAGADRDGGADVHHRGQLHDPAQHHARGAGPGDGAVHAGLPRRDAAWLP